MQANVYLQKSLHLRGGDVVKFMLPPREEQSLGRCGGFSRECEGELVERETKNLFFISRRINQSFASLFIAFFFVSCFSVSWFGNLRLVEVRTEA